MLGRVLIVLLSGSLAACTQTGGGASEVGRHYVDFGAEPPKGNRITVCHAYTCKMQTPYTFSQKDIAEIRATGGNRASIVALPPPSASDAWKKPPRHNP